MYHATCPSELYDENYIGETCRPIAERVKDHNGRDHKSHILKHSLFSIISNNFYKNKRKQKISESLLIKNYAQHLISTTNQYH